MWLRETGDTKMSQTKKDLKILKECLEKYIQAKIDRHATGSEYAKELSINAISAQKFYGEVIEKKIQTLSVGYLTKNWKVKTERALGNITEFYNSISY